MSAQGSPRAPGRPASRPRAARIPFGILLALVFAATACAFWPAARQGFVDWDDGTNFVRNPHWRGLAAENLRWMFSTLLLGHYQPLTWLSFAVEHELWGPSPQRMHLVSLLIHASNAVLFALLARRLLDFAAGRSPGAANEEQRERALSLGAVCAALLFGLHPLRAESVAWATERRDVLCALFLLLSLLAWLRLLRAERRRGLWWSLALGSFALSILSKAIGMGLPLVLLVLDGFPLRRFEALRSRGASRLRALASLALEKWAFFALALAGAAVAACAQTVHAGSIGATERSLAQRAALAAYGLVFYLRKTLLPSDLSPLYALDVRFDPFAAPYLASMAFVLALTAALWILRARFPAGLAAWAAYVVWLAPVLGLFKSGLQQVADRYSYLATMPLALLAGGLALALARSKRALVAASAATAVIAAALGIASWRATQVWRDSESLWTRAVEHDPESCAALHHLAVAIRDDPARAREAIALERRSIELCPGPENKDARYLLGLLQMLGGQREEGLAAWRAGLALDPRDLGWFQTLAGELWRSGDRDGAREVWLHVLAASPELARAWIERGRLFQLDGRLQEARECGQRALALAPDSVEALALSRARE
jgi:protein O-mannosyl-transferase